MGIRIALLQGSRAGTNVYQETFTRNADPAMQEGPVEQRPMNIQD